MWAALEQQFLYSKAVTVYWDRILDWQHEHVPGANCYWSAFGVQGTTPYFFDVAMLGLIGQG